MADGHSLVVLKLKTSFLRNRWSCCNEIWLPVDFTFSYAFVL